jgi:hypothetical protein
MEYEYSDSEIEKACDILWGSILEIPNDIMKPEEKRRKAKMFRKFKLDILIKRAMANS